MSIQSLHHITIGCNDAQHTVDAGEQRGSAGTSLKLPPWLEPHRSQTESGRHPIEVPAWAAAR
jgi:hypothetical protein